MTPIFAKTQHVLLFRICFYFPYFSKFSPDFVQFTCFLPTLCVFCFPLVDHDAFMHRTMHVLDASGAGSASVLLSSLLELVVK